jgi:hypothetical protein
VQLLNHVFLSHAWSTGQEQMRLVKQRLLEMVPGLKVWLDVDDLVTLDQGYDVVTAQTTLVFCSAGFFDRPNCVRELLRAVCWGRPIIAVLEPEAGKGGLTLAQIREGVERADGQYGTWKLEAAMEAWGKARPSVADVLGALFAKEPIEWNRKGELQDVTMRLIAERLLPAAHPPVYLQGEVAAQPPASLEAPRREHHLYCSASNAGAARLVAELGAHLGGKLAVAHGVDALGACDRMLVYLTARTWTSGEASDALAREVARAMDAGVRLLLVHEQPGEIGGQAGRDAVPFDDFFVTTPAPLLERQVYQAMIAVPLRGGAWREAGLALLANHFRAAAPSRSWRNCWRGAEIAGGRQVTLCRRSVTDTSALNGGARHADVEQGGGVPPAAVPPEVGRSQLGVGILQPPSLMLRRECKVAPDVYRVQSKGD